MEQVRKRVVDSKDFLISPKYRASSWRDLHLDTDNEADWSKAIDIVEDRIDGRLVRWINFVVDEKFSGFSVIALDCLLIETLVGFMTGEASKGPNAFLIGELTTGTALRFTKEEAEEFRKNVRNGILHDAETRCGWIVQRGESDGQILTKDGSTIFLNRNAFHRAIVRELDAWLTRIRNGDKALRNNMRQRMEQILRKHSEAVQ